MRSLKNNRKPWVVALIIIIALIMVLPIYDVVNVVGDNRNAAGSPDASPQDFMEELREEAERLENYIEEREPTVPVLQELAQIYRTMSMFMEEEEVNYTEKATIVMEDAVELDPSDPGNYLFLFELYNELGKTEEAVEKAETLEAMLLEQLENDPADNTSRFYYSILLEDYHGDLSAAREQLEMILDTEPEESQLYAHAKTEIERIDNLTEPENGEDNG